jgi:hypothetical protein
MNPEPAETLCRWEQEMGTGGLSELAARVPLRRIGPCLDHDDRPADVRAEGGGRSGPRLLRQPPREDVVGILMTQHAWDSPHPPQVYLDFWTLAYQAIDD